MIKKIKYGSLEMEDIIYKKVREDFRKRGFWVGNRKSVGFGSVLNVRKGKFDGFVIIDFAKTRYKDRQDLVALRRYDDKTGSWKDVWSKSPRSFFEKGEIQ